MRPLIYLRLTKKFLKVADDAKEVDSNQVSDGTGSIE